MMVMDKREAKRFVLCIENKENEASLEKWKIYQCIPDEDAEKYNEIRVIDEEGEDYLYPSEYFSSISLEPSIAKMFLMQHSNSEQS